MKRHEKYAIQMKPRPWDKTWTTYTEFDTMEEAQAAYDSLPIKSGYRIAEAYTVVRYKEIKQ